MQKSNNISQISPINCSGCSACKASCPVDAISMQPDREGFLYPVIDNEKCIDCGKCLKTCLSSYPYRNFEQRLYASWSNNNELRSKSSSGGLFSVIASYVFNLNGAVVGAGFNEDFSELQHLLIYNDKFLDNLRRSKFIQSNKLDIYRKVKDYLKTGNLLLFVGTPCEVGGLRQFLKDANKYPNLITCDFICGCVSSPMVYRKFVNSLKLKYKSPIVSVNFKDKRGGWRAKSIAVKFESGEEYYNSILDDDYCVSFHSRYNIRPSCFNCKYRSFERSSDITLGDFWAIEKYYPSYDDNKGTSFLLANSLKGDSLIHKLENIQLKPVDIDLKEYASQYNWCFFKNPVPPLKVLRNQFYEDLETMSFVDACSRNLSEIKENRKKIKLGLK